MLLSCHMLEKQLADCSVSMLSAAPEALGLNDFGGKFRNDHLSK